MTDVVVGAAGLEFDAPKEPAWTDLADNKPDDAVRERAQREWDETHARMPVVPEVAPVPHMDATDRGWALSADDDESVGLRLAQLEGWGWRTLHSVSVGRRSSDIIDHLLIGPGGVFAINTKDHSNAKVWVSDGVIFVDGEETPHLRIARYEGGRVSEVLTRETPWTVPATPVVVVISDTYVVKRLPEDVVVLRRCDVPNYFKGLPRIFCEEYADWIFDTARKSTTWN